MQVWKKKWFVLRTGKLAYYKDDRVSVSPLLLWSSGEERRFSILQIGLPLL